MFDNVAFEVVIGLVFIYLLYSLLVTILGEIISTAFGIRARLLRVAIERMLNDGYYYKLAREKRQTAAADTPEVEQEKAPIDTFKWRRGPVLTQHPDFKKSFAGKFYDYPAIKYLGRLETEKKGRLTLSKPSYISPDYFADSLMNFLADKGAGAGLMEKIGFSLKFNTYHIQPNTRRQFVNLFESSPTIEAYKLNLMRWFNETMDRASGWHKRKMRLISFITGLVIAMAFNVDTIALVRILSTDKEARAQLVEMGIAATKDPGRYPAFVTTNAGSPPAAAILDSGFVRVTNDINAANSVLGLGWDVSHLLATDDVSIKEGELALPLATYTDSLTALTRTTNGINGRITAMQHRLTLYKRQLDSLYNDTTIAINEGVLKRNTDSVKAYQRLANDIVAAATLQSEINILQAQLRTDSAAAAAGEFLKLSLYTTLGKSSKTAFSLIDSVAPGPKGTTRIWGRRPYTGGEKSAYILSHIFWYSLIGFILTAIALSMGAPFWFDLLNKLVTIRGVGTKPEEKKAVPLTPADAVLLHKDGSAKRVAAAAQEPVADVVEAALKLYAVAIRAIPGVKAVFTTTTAGAKGLQVNVNNAVTEAEVQRLFPHLHIGQVVVPLSVVISGTPANQTGRKGRISNRSGINGFGSLGCIVMRRETGSKHILSCWHVLKGDLNYAGTDDEPFIIDHDDNRQLAERWAGGIRDQFDYGLARCNDDSTYKDNSFLKSALGITAPTLQHRFVSQADVDNQLPVKYYNGLTGKITRGFIYAVAEEADINYIDKTRTIKDVLLLSNDAGQSISNEGNSGAVVFDERDKAIAMIIGGDLKYTYAIKLFYIFQLHKEMVLV